jgi:hypothetical protein
MCPSKIHGHPPQKYTVCNSRINASSAQSSIGERSGDPREFSTMGCKINLIGHDLQSAENCLQPLVSSILVYQCLQISANRGPLNDCPLMNQHDDAGHISD